MVISKTYKNAVIVSQYAHIEAQQYILKKKKNTLESKHQSSGV